MVSLAWCSGFYHGLSWIQSSVDFIAASSVGVFAGGGHEKEQEPDVDDVHAGVGGAGGPWKGCVTSGR